MRAPPVSTAHTLASLPRGVGPSSTSTRHEESSVARLTRPMPKCAAHEALAGLAHDAAVAKTHDARLPLETTQRRLPCALLRLAQLAPNELILGEARTNRLTLFGHENTRSYRQTGSSRFWSSPTRRSRGQSVRTLIVHSSSVVPLPRSRRAAASRSHQPRPPRHPKAELPRHTSPATHRDQR
jgi:hypothetical protein